MRLFLLVITIILLVVRICNTPEVFSRKSYEKKKEKALKKYAETCEEGYTEPEMVEDVKIVATVISFITLLLSAVYYIIIGNRFSENLYVFILSAIQVVLTLYGLSRNLHPKEVIKRIKNGKFPNLYSIYNTIVDYAYYPVVIYLLLMQ